MTNMAVMILAAGGATRFGSCKSLEMINGKPMLQHSIDHAREICPDSVYVVSGSWHAAFCKALENDIISNVSLIENRDWSMGIGRSISVGVAHLGSKYDAILILLADQVAVATGDLKRLVKCFDGKDIACSFYGNKRGVPALFGSRTFYSLIQLSGEKGGKNLLYHKSYRVEELSMESASIDIDTPLELKLWLEGRL
ncbi:nucleotidyltransferase family protein [Neptunomonas sp.]|uniref:nucleotidyltransferase family protein n=1 Tax=Neptunomonas sp. TaxID=1971898 RepID=UPI0035693EC9